MKKLFFALTLITTFSFAGFSQSPEKKIKANKWFVTGAFNSKNITLSKTSPSQSDGDIKFADNGNMNYCTISQANFVSSEGVEVKAGSSYCDHLYTYEIKGDMLHVKYPLADWHYKITSLANGDIELVFTPATN